MKNIFANIENQGVAPVIALSSVEKAVPLAKALIEGGINNIEVTLRTDCALDCIRAIKKAFPEMTVSAGTCLKIDDVKNAVEAGVDYVVTPGFDEELVSFCCKNNVGVIPGCVTPTELSTGIKYGLKYFKYFPSESLGGLKAIELLCGPFKGIKFMPTGGITFDNLETYLKSKYIVACGGSYMAKSSLIEAEDWSAITQNCKKAMDISLGFTLAHVGINNQDPETAKDVCTSIADIFRLPVKIGNSSDFAGTYVECMNKMYYGKNGHIGFFTNSVERARAYFESKGLEIIEESYKKAADGVGSFFYIKKEVGGFALHVVRKS